MGAHGSSQTFDSAVSTVSALVYISFGKGQATSRAAASTMRFVAASPLAALEIVALASLYRARANRSSHALRTQAALPAAAQRRGVSGRGERWDDDAATRRARSDAAGRPPPSAAPARGRASRHESSIERRSSAPDAEAAGVEGRRLLEESSPPPPPRQRAIHRHSSSVL